MSHVATIEWKTSGNAELLATEDELVDMLKHIALETAVDTGIGILIRKPIGQEMTVIIAGEAWSLDWFPVRYDGLGSHHTVADEYNPNELLPVKPEVLTYYLLGQHGEVPVQFAISEDKALAAIRQFLSTPEKPCAVRWDLD